MSEGLNEWTGLGNLTADAELRRTNSSTSVLSFRIACSNSRYNSEKKERKEHTEYVNCTLWGKRGESLAQYLAKGSRVLVKGEMRTRSYEAKDGSKRYATEIAVDEIILLGGRGERSIEQCGTRSDARSPSERAREE